MAKLNWDTITIMVVDDNSFMRNLITSTVKSFGIKEVVRARNAAAAIKMLKQSRTDPVGAGIGTIDIILSDFVMPMVDGNLFLRWLRTDDNTPNRFVPFIMISGAADRHVVEQARDTGATEFMAKPFSAQSIADRILQVVNSPRQFVLAPGFFGPDRRRQIRTANWGGILNGEDLAEAVLPPVKEERRTTDASQIQVIQRASNEKALRGDVRAIYFRLPNLLRDKLGPNAYKGQVYFDPMIIQAAELRIKELVGDYTKWVMQYIESLSEAHAALKGGRNKGNVKNIAEISRIAHELRGQGGTFDYPLITAFGKSLYEATSNHGMVVTEDRLKLLEAHIDTIRMVFKQRIKGDGGKLGETLLEEIEVAVNKYKN
jgi:CheY-like chemotaxis protein